jgi:diguanylate cyclase (GGDEF)-like protein
MVNESTARAKTLPVRVRMPAPWRLRDEAEPYSAQPTRNVPSELAALLGEVQRLAAELADARAKVTELEATADVDAVTGIFNRRGFERELKRSLAYVRRYDTRAAVFYLDLDGFKPVNDQYGHAAGDAVLKAVADLLTQNVRASDIVGRIGGDEFGAILWNLSEADATTKAWTIESAIGAADIAWEGLTLAVGASIGFTMLGHASDTADALARADRAMYARKAARKGSELPQVR